MNRKSWWTGVRPETDLQEANDIIGFMLEDWQKVGEALGFDDFVDPEVIIEKIQRLSTTITRPDLTTLTLELSKEMQERTRKMRKSFESVGLKNSDINAYVPMFQGQIARDFWLRQVEKLA